MAGESPEISIYGLEVGDRRDSIESEPTSETDTIIPFDILQRDLQKNYTEHIKAIENASLGILDGVVLSAKTGFHTSLILNVLSFILGLGIIVTGLIVLIKSPGDWGRIVGVVSSLIGLILVITLLFLKGPLDRILESVSNLARINVITIGLAHRLNQISRVFVQESLKGKMTLSALNTLNGMIDKAVHHSVKEFQVILPKEQAEEQVRKILTATDTSSQKAVSESESVPQEPTNH